jgi:Alginate export
MALALLAGSHAAHAQELTFSHEGAVQLVPQHGMFWGLAERFSPSVPYKDDSMWVEAYVKGKAAFGDPQGQGWYGAASLLATGTIGTDAFATGDTGRLKLEDAYLGWRRPLAQDWVLDLSAGSRDYRIGEGMLYAMGGGNGFERGALTLAPHRNWQLAALVRASNAAWTVDAFYLDPDELSSGDTGTKLAGLRAEWKPKPNARVGITFSHVLASMAPYPLAPIGLIENGRDGLDTWSMDASYAPNEGPLAGWNFKTEVAMQRSDRLDLRAWGAVAEIGYRWTSARFTPRLSYSPRYFSGDKPSTVGRIERFDPLFYDGAPSTWSSGGNGSLAFYNSNLMVQQVRLELAFSQRDFANLSFYDVRAAERFSPIQYGQAARLGILGNDITVVSGVPEKPLTHEVYAEYTRVLSPHWFLTAGVAGAKPRGGLLALVPNAGTWWGGIVNVTWRY